MDGVAAEAAHQEVIVAAPETVGEADAGDIAKRFIQLGNLLVQQELLGNHVDHPRQFQKIEVKTAERAGAAYTIALGSRAEHHDLLEHRCFLCRDRLGYQG